MSTDNNGPMNTIADVINAVLHHVMAVCPLVQRTVYAKRIARIARNAPTVNDFFHELVLDKFHVNERLLQLANTSTDVVYSSDSIRTDNYITTKTVVYHDANGSSAYFKTPFGLTGSIKAKIYRRYTTAEELIALFKTHKIPPDNFRIAYKQAHILMKKNKVFAGTEPLVFNEEVLESLKVLDNVPGELFSLTLQGTPSYHMIKELLFNAFPVPVLQDPDFDINYHVNTGLYLSDRKSKYDERP